MPTSGCLTIRVHRIEADWVESKLQDEPLAVRFATGRNEAQTKFRKTDAKLDETLTLRVMDAAASAQLTMELLQRPKKTLATKVQLLADFQKTREEREMTFAVGPKAAPNTARLLFSVDWKSDDDWKCGEKAVTAFDGFRRPWFMRVAYYYETYKTAYNYVTSFSVVAPFARYRENVADAALTSVSGKTLFEIDKAWVGPGLNALDDKVDSVVSSVMAALFDGPEDAQEKMGQAVEMAILAKDFAAKTALAVSSVMYDILGDAADYTKTQVMHAASSVRGPIKDMLISVLSYVQAVSLSLQA
ncbi:hypothetical protein PHYBOEH_004262 [Phytophthora boehmeriae]|uniref:Uncharacterized protein n=1 Tax=Phytophthora boehmeriae TaxID=109152 RepID=A0A8T1WNS9_9STRA|nr:hypothetical protein PHYBOEH_004262 [Phytophthora boehmeriae]